MANTVWAFATAAVKAEILFTTVAVEARKRIGDFNSQNLVNMVWAFATAGVTAQALFNAVAVEAPRRIGDFNSQDLANTIWAFATVGVAAQTLFNAIASAALRRIRLGCELDGDDGVPPASAMVSRRALEALKVNVLVR